ncbi:MAG: HAD family hydrolase [Clostridia bacterium]|nr:HAD family hydrolase [Clostridia bacterium]
MELFYPEYRLQAPGLLIFDLDGTLADTIGGIRDGVNLAMQKYGYPQRSYEEIRLAIGNGARELIRRSVPTDTSKDTALVDRVYEDYNLFYGQTYGNCQPYEGIRECLATLRERGYTLAVLSNKQDAYVKAMTVEIFGEELFSYIAGQTELPRKPDPTVPLLIASSLNFSPAGTAFVGDSDVDVQTGRNAGMLAVGCSWGYRDRSALIEKGAHAVVDAPMELAELFT